MVAASRPTPGARVEVTAGRRRRRRRRGLDGRWQRGGRRRRRGLEAGGGGRSNQPVSSASSACCQRDAAQRRAAIGQDAEREAGRDRPGEHQPAGPGSQGRRRRRAGRRGRPPARPARSRAARPTGRRGRASDSGQPRGRQPGGRHGHRQVARRLPDRPAIVRRTRPGVPPAHRPGRRRRDARRDIRAPASAGGGAQGLEARARRGRRSPPARGPDVCCGSSSAMARAIGRRVRERAQRSVAMSAPLAQRRQPQHLARGRRVRPPPRGTVSAGRAVARVVRSRLLRAGQEQPIRRQSRARAERPEQA